MSKNAIEALKKAHQAMAITNDDYSLEKYLIKHEEKGIARMAVIGLEAKYVPSIMQKNPNSRGYRTRFLLADGNTVGTFSNGAFLFFEFFAGIMGKDIREMPAFLHIDIDGVILVDVTQIALDATRSTYNFELVTEGSELRGMSDYLPTMQNLIALEAPRQAAATAEEPDGEPEKTTTGKAKQK